MKHWATTHGWLLSVTLIVVAASACGSPSRATTSTSFHESSPTAEIRLVIENVGGTVSGTIDIAETSPTTGVAEVSRAQISGTMSGNDLKFNATGRSALLPIGFRGTLSATEIAGVLRSGSAAQRARLLGSHNELPPFATAVNELNARSRTAHAVPLSAVMRLGGRASRLARESGALSTDLAALNAAFQSEVVDVHVACDDVATALATTKNEPQIARAAICASVSNSVAAATDVANEAAFVAGFIHGLNTSKANVSNLTTALAISARELGVDATSASSTTTTLPGVAAIASEIRQARAVLVSTISRSVEVAAAAQADLRIIYVAANSLIVTTSCRGPLSEPTPLSAVARA